MRNPQDTTYTGRVLMQPLKYADIKSAHAALTIPAFFTRPLFKIEIDVVHRYESSSRKDPQILINAIFVPEDKSMGLKSAHIPLILQYIEGGLRQFEFK